MRDSMSMWLDRIGWYDEEVEEQEYADESSADLSPCDPDLYAGGDVLLRADIGVVGERRFEDWVKSLAMASRCRVDWYIEGGDRVIVKYLGDKRRVVEALRTLKVPEGIVVLNDDDGCGCLGGLDDKMGELSRAFGEFGKTFRRVCGRVT